MSLGKRSVEGISHILYSTYIYPMYNSSARYCPVLYVRTQWMPVTEGQSNSAPWAALSVLTLCLSACYLTLATYAIQLLTSSGSCYLRNPAAAATYAIQLLTSSGKCYLRNPAADIQRQNEGFPLYRKWDKCFPCFRKELTA